MSTDAIADFAVYDLANAVDALTALLQSGEGSQAVVANSERVYEAAGKLAAILMFLQAVENAS